MNRLLLYVHFNKYNQLSSHVIYQLEKIRPLFKNVIFISNSQLNSIDKSKLQENGLFDDFIQRENTGFDFAAWRDGFNLVGWDSLKEYDSVTLMNDTCFGPLWDLDEYYQRFESNQDIDFWGMTNHRKYNKYPEHLQSYYLSFKRSVINSKEFEQFWSEVEDFDNVQDVIDHYETQVTTIFVEAGFKFQSVFNTVNEDITGMLHPDFSYYNPTALLNHDVPFIKIKTIDANQHIAPYILNHIESVTNYPIDLIISHMSQINYPDFKYLLGRKVLKSTGEITTEKKIAVHLHVFYVDLLGEFLHAFSNFGFHYDLFITTDIEKKQLEIQQVLSQFNIAAEVVVTGNIGRDVLPMLKLKSSLENYDYVGHFHTKKSKEADFWAGESWRQELIDMLVVPANDILATMEQKTDVGIVIADIPSFFRFNKVVDAYNEHLIAPIMNELWERMKLTKVIDFNAFHTFVMSYGTFVWFKYDALQPLFDLELTDLDVPTEPLPQNSILHAIERLLVYVAWNQHYDFRISPNSVYITPFIDNKLLNVRGDALPSTYVNFDYMGGIKGALKYIVIGPARAIKYIVRRCVTKYL